MLLVTSPRAGSCYNYRYQAITNGTSLGSDILVASNMKGLVGALADLKPDLIFVAGFPRKLPPNLLELPRLGCINLHPSLLPRYRGPDPLFWQFMNDETHVGFTFHRMDTDFDTGPILIQRHMEIAPEDDISSFYAKLLDQALSTLPEVLHAVATGMPGIPQSTEDASYAPLCTEVERQLDWTRTATQLRNQVRAWGWGGALAKINGQTILIRRTKIVNSPLKPARSEPGSILERSDEGLLVQTGHGVLLIEDFAYYEVPP